MGDRTRVRLTVPTALIEKARKIFVPIEGNTVDEWPADTEHTFVFDEVNYGELGCLSNFEAAGIAYDSEWDAGGEYGAGTKYCRFTKDGEAIVKEIYDNDWGIPLDRLLPHLEDHAKLKEVIQEFGTKLAILPWDDQVENGKTYQLKQLINPT